MRRWIMLGGVLKWKASIEWGDGLAIHIHVGAPGTVFANCLLARPELQSLAVVARVWRGPCSRVVSRLDACHCR